MFASLAENGRNCYYYHSPQVCQNPVLMLLKDMNSLIYHSVGPEDIDAIPKSYFFPAGLVFFAPLRLHGFSIPS